MAENIKYEILIRESSINHWKTFHYLALHPYIGPGVIVDHTNLRDFANELVAFHQQHHRYETLELINRSQSELIVGTKPSNCDEAFLHRPLEKDEMMRLGKEIIRALQHSHKR